MTKAQQRPLLGIGLMVLGMLLVPLLDACAKVLSRDYPVLEITWARFMFHFLWLLPVVHWQRLPWWKIPPMPGTQVVRSLFLTFATLLFFLAIKDNPIPNALALLFISPLVVTLVAPFVLGERFDGRRAGAAVVGFIGVLVVLRPTSDAFQPSVLFALAAGISYACYLMATRKIANRSAPLLTLFYTAIAGLLLLSVMVPAVWVTPDAKGWGLMALMGLFAAAGHYMIIRACEYASASLLSPFNYTEIICATAVSYLLFGYFPDVMVWVGIAIISLSGIYVSMLEYRSSKKKLEHVDL
ncbi:MAG: DMT family transporter [Pseudomonadales bacterium]